MDNLYIFLLIICVVFPEMTVNTTKETIEIWATNVLPQLFPFFIISKCIFYSGGLEFFSKILKPVTRLLHIDENAAFPIVMSLLCGYQTGSRTVESLNLIKNKDFYANICYWASPLFIIGTVGTAILKNTKTGYALYVIHLCTFFIFTTFYASKQQTEKIANLKGEGNLGKAVAESIYAIFSICGFMIFYRLIIKIITVKLPQNISAIVAGIIEFTSGIKLSSEIYTEPLPIISFFLSFGGICVIAQCISTLKNINKTEYIKNRLLCGIISYILCLIYKKTALYVPVIITIVVIVTVYTIRRKKTYWLKSAKSCEICSSISLTRT